jgi:hypothetical protein
MDTLTQVVVNKLLDWGSDLIGIAPVERFAPPEGGFVHQGHMSTELTCPDGCKRTCVIAADNEDVCLNLFFTLSEMTFTFFIVLRGY